MINKHIKKLQGASNFDECLEFFQAILQDYGFDRYCLLQASIDTSPAIFKIKRYFTNYPQEWMDVYLERQYFFADPIGAELLANRTPFYWSEYMQHVDMKLIKPEALEIMQGAMEHGICDGAGMSYIRNKGSLYTLAISSPTPMMDYDHNILAELYLIGSHLTCLFEKFNAVEKTDIYLTDKEQTVVTFGAIGKTDAEIAQIMSISINTVRFHWKNIFQKFDCYNRVFAIIQAMNLGFVNTNIFEVPTESGSTQTYQKRIQMNDNKK